MRDIPLQVEELFLLELAQLVTSGTNAFHRPDCADEIQWRSVLFGQLLQAFENAGQVIALAPPIPSQNLNCGRVAFGAPRGQKNGKRCDHPRIALRRVKTSRLLQRLATKYCHKSTIHFDESQVKPDQIVSLHQALQTPVVPAK